MEEEDLSLDEILESMKDIDTAEMEIWRLGYWCNTCQANWKGCHCV